MGNTHTLSADGLMANFRSLQIHQQTGVPHSQLLEEQRGQEGGSSLGGPLRFLEPCIFWLHSDMDGKALLIASWPYFQSLRFSAPIFGLELLDPDPPAHFGFLCIFWKNFTLPQH